MLSKATSVVMRNLLEHLICFINFNATIIIHVLCILAYRGLPFSLGSYAREQSSQLTGGPMQTVDPLVL